MRKLITVVWTPFKVTRDSKVVLTPLNKDLEIPFEENAIKSYVLAQARDGNPAFASDHQLIEVFIEL